MNRSRVIKNYSSPARDSVPWPKLFDPVGIRLKSSKVDRTKTCRQTSNKTDSSLLSSVYSLFFFSDWSNAVVLIYAPLFCRSAWFTNRGACTGSSPVRLHSSGPPWTQINNRGAWKAVSKASKPTPLPLNRSMVSPIIALYLWQRDSGSDKLMKYKLSM